MTKLHQIPRTIWEALPFTSEASPVVAHLEFTGVIGGDSRTSKALNLKRLEKAIDEAFEINSLKAVAISINSPGGSPVQSRLIHDRVRLLADEKKIPVLTFIEDVGASGGYILSLAGDEIFADPSSVVGSIGVISGAFGFPDAMEKLGIERRVYTAGNNKSQLDPFKPENPADVARLQTLLDGLHAIFIDLVKTRRSDKLTEDSEVFSGNFWLADQAKAYGLIDAIGEMRSVLRERYGKDISIKKINTDERSFLQKILSRHIPAVPTSLIDAGEVMEAAEVRSLWARYGR